ncbi:Zn-dependent hydrolase [Kitasatospora sp. NPDC052896]|uniref:Zn-dependent hydrolase n=1 Tax=Kitasatospora sp. NPDC052896 TaxID=3364061 RepID=UPI0037CAEB48
MTAPIARTALRVDGVRLLDVLARLAEIGADPAGGVSRLGLSAEENEGRAFLRELARDAGLVTETDAAGNLFVRRPGGRPEAPVLLMGSHLDSVRQGGRLDGAYGVVAAVEVLRVFASATPWLELPYEPVVVAFANEEGALVQYPFWGSRALSGQLADGLSARDRAGRSVRAYLLAAGGDPERLDAAAWAPGRIGAFLELHIEQGPVLERRGVQIGVVDGIVGRTIFDAEVAGQVQHAGTTPMPDRRDALAAAADVVLGVRRIAATERLCSTATVGYLDVSPNVTNTVPGTVRLSAEVRDTDPERIARAEAAVREVCAEVEKTTGCRVTVTVAARSRPVSTDPLLRRAIAEAAEELGLTRLTMPSGAGHDAQMVAEIAPVGMIFVPSRDGISHAPAEDTAPEALVCGADVLLQAALRVQELVTAVEFGPAAFGPAELDPTELDPARTGRHPTTTDDGGGR